MADTPGAAAVFYEWAAAAGIAIGSAVVTVIGFLIKQTYDRRGAAAAGKMPSDSEADLRRELGHYATKLEVSEARRKVAEEATSGRKELHERIDQLGEELTRHVERFTASITSASAQFALERERISSNLSEAARGFETRIALQEKDIRHTKAGLEQQGIAGGELGNNQIRIMETLKQIDGRLNKLEQRRARANGLPTRRR